jgi:hypothetical protein
MGKASVGVATEQPSDLNSTVSYASNVGHKRVGHSAKTTALPTIYLGNLASS